jgi:hypothetical protein
VQEEEAALLQRIKEESLDLDKLGDDCRIVNDIVVRERHVGSSLIIIDSASREIKRRADLNYTALTKWSVEIEEDDEVIMNDEVSLGGLGINYSILEALSLGYRWVGEGTYPKKKEQRWIDPFEVPAELRKFVARPADWQWYQIVKKDLSEEDAITDCQTLEFVDVGKFYVRRRQLVQGVVQYDLLVKESDIDNVKDFIDMDKDAVVSKDNEEHAKGRYWNGVEWKDDSTVVTKTTVHKFTTVFSDKYEKTKAGLKTALEAAEDLTGATLGHEVPEAPTEPPPKKLTKSEKRALRRELREGKRVKQMRDEKQLSSKKIRGTNLDIAASVTKYPTI